MSFDGNEEDDERVMDISQLKHQGDVKTRRIEVERQRIKKLDQVMAKTRKNITNTRKAMGGINAAKENNTAVYTQIHMFEKRLVHANQVYNSTLGETMKLKRLIDDLRRETSVFYKVYKRLGREYEHKKTECQKMVVEANMSHSERAKMEREIKIINEQKRKETAKFSDECTALQMKLEEEARAKAKEKGLIPDVPDDEHRGFLSPEEEQSLKRKVAHGAWTLSKEKAAIHHVTQKAANYEEAFMKIQDATGVHDIDELVNKFIEAEDANFSQLTHVQQLSKELERVEMQVTETQQDIQRYKSQGSSSDDQRLKILKMIDDQLRTGRKRVKSTERRLKESREHARRLKMGACQLFNEIGCENSFEVAGLGHTSKTLLVENVTDMNVMKYLGIIEQRANEVLQLYFLRMKEKAAAEKPAMDELGRPISRQRGDRLRLQTGPQVSHGSAKVTLDQAKWDAVTKQLTSEVPPTSPLHHHLGHQHLGAEEAPPPSNRHDVEDLDAIRQAAQDAVTRPLSRPGSGGPVDLSSFGVTGASSLELGSGE